MSDLQTVYPEPTVGVCANHPETEAEIVCEVCGDFLCGICVLPHRGLNFCPHCYERWRRGHAVLPDEEGALGGVGTVLLGLSGLLLAPLILVDVVIWVSLLLWLVCLILGLCCLASARALQQLVVEGQRAESGRLMARIGNVLAVLTMTSSCAAILLIWMFPKAVAP